MKRILQLAIVCLTLVLVLITCSCTTVNRRMPMMTTTVNRPVLTQRMTASGGVITTNGVETVTTQQPYQSPAFHDAGTALFSR